MNGWMDRWTDGWYLNSNSSTQAIIVFDSINYEPVTGPGYPQWSETLGWLTVAFIMMWIPIWYIGAYCYKGGFKVSHYLFHESLLT